MTDINSLMITAFLTSQETLMHAFLSPTCLSVGTSPRLLREPGDNTILTWLFALCLIIKTCILQQL